jgi:hypothetical protein
LVPIFATLSELLTKRIRVGIIAASGCVVSALGAAGLQLFRTGALSG